MSLKTWKEEFYPRTARDVEARAPQTPKGNLALVEHSLKKWEGTLVKNRKKHDVDLRCKYIMGEDDSLDFTDETCALCLRFRLSYGHCEECPLAIVRGGVSCDRRRPDEISDSPYKSFTTYGDPQPMIKWLRLAKKMLEDQIND